MMGNPKTCFTTFIALLKLNDACARVHIIP
jgi:hypothetical protein